jgi:hypothetical protein
MPREDRENRYSHTSGSGSNEPKQHERKEQRPDWKPRQGGDQTRGDQTRGDQTRGDDDRLEPPIDPGEREKLR